MLEMWLMHRDESQLNFIITHAPVHFNDFVCVEKVKGKWVECPGQMSSVPIVCPFVGYHNGTIIATTPAS